jgi:hypothetical protein
MSPPPSGGCVRAQVCVAVMLTLLLGACAARDGYVFDAGGSSHPHPSAALCASWGQRLDTSASEDGQCVLPSVATALAPPPVPLSVASPRVPPPPAPHPAQISPKPPSAPPAPAAAARIAAVEPDATGFNELKSDRKSEFMGAVRESNYRCGTPEVLRRVAVSADFKLVCHGARCCLLPHFHR